VSFHREIEGAEPVRPEAIGTREERRVRNSTRLAVGTLACPDCDAPVAPPLAPLAPADPMGCGFCRHSAAVRDFLSLAPPTRPTRVDVRVVRRRRT
jgi:hypothetical protein